MVKKIIIFISLLVCILSVNNVHAIAPTITSTQWQYGARQLDGTGVIITKWYNPNTMNFSTYGYPFLYSFQSTFLSTSNVKVLEGSAVGFGNNQTYYIYFDLILSSNNQLTCRDFTYDVEFFNEYTDAWENIGEVTCKDMVFATGIYTQDGYPYNGYHTVLQVALPPNFHDGYDIIDVTATSTIAAFHDINPYQIGMTGITYDTQYDGTYKTEGQNAQIITQNQTIINQNNTTNNKLDNLDGTLNNSNIDNPDFEEFEEYLANNGVITQLITLPVRLYSQILNNINGNCVDFNLGNMFGTNLTMSCINPSGYLGSTLWNTIDVLFSGFFIYAISKKMVNVFQQFTNLEEGDILD